MKSIKENEENNVKLNNYYMRGSDDINPNEKIAIAFSEQDTSVHMHDFIEIVYFTSGVGTHYVDGKMYSVCPGSVCVMDSNVKHHYYVDRAYCNTLAVKNIIFYREFLGCSSEKFLYEFAQKYGLSLGAINEHTRFVHILLDQERELDKCMLLIEKEMKMKQDNYLQVVRSLVEAMLLILISGRGTQISGRKYNKNYLTIEASIEFLNENVQNVPAMKDVAKKYGFSSEYYSKLFREFTGKSYVEFVQEMKCNEAARLLINTDYTNEVIANLSGFSSLKHFYKQFKLCKGVSPREYVKQNT